MAVVRADGSLWLVEADGRSAILADTQQGIFGFPSWSPDGKRIASIRTSTTETSIVVIDATAAASGLPVAPLTIFESTTIGPFYLSWTPDGKQVSFLASDTGGLALRIAPADGSAPLDGSGRGAVIRGGDPFYYDWIDSEHLLAHIGAGPDSFLGEIDLGGKPIGPALGPPGSFRSADVSGDGRYAGFVRTGKNGAGMIVIAARDGSGEHTMPVGDLAAVDFSPTADTLASIGAIVPIATPLGVPLGPLRLIDGGSGKVRTLIDSDVVTFSWSPDGTTIAAIRVVPAAGGSLTSTASPPPSPAPSGGSEIRLTFVDVATGTTRSESVIRPGRRYVDALMTYFDQYALSHRQWAPDSSSFLVPQVDLFGTTSVDVFFPNGDAHISLEGEMGFWSP